MLSIFKIDPCIKQASHRVILHSSLLSYDRSYHHEKAATEDKMHKKAREGPQKNKACVGSWEKEGERDWFS